jgi:hypothetical protein
MADDRQCVHCLRGFLRVETSRKKGKSSQERRMKCDFCGRVKTEIVPRSAITPKPKTPPAPKAAKAAPPQPTAEVRAQRRGRVLDRKLDAIEQAQDGEQRGAGDELGYTDAWYSAPSGNYCKPGVKGGEKS